MHSTGKKFTILVCGIFAAAGCVDAASVTAPPWSVPESPSLNAGGWFGTGNRADSASGSDTCAEERGGGWVGPGGRVEDPCGATSTAAGVGTAGSGN
jgi:hypothetical protein